ncbi:hypothetical protein GOV04_05260 [Candidatus Woesearchaeota archaeon]|nr:hypothetical protein [Candidatus Woesearchaeota archaeon]
MKLLKRVEDYFWSGNRLAKAMIFYGFGVVILLYGLYYQKWVIAGIAIAFLVIDTIINFLSWSQYN